MNVNVSTYDLYTQKLESLYQKWVILDNPLDLKPYCPHLSEGQIQELFAFADREKSVCIAIPSILLRRSFHQVKLIKNANDLSKPIQWELEHAWIIISEEREKRGFAEGSYDAKKVKFRREAEDYASKTWGEKLVDVNWNRVITYWVSRPKEITITCGGDYDKANHTIVGKIFASSLAQRKEIESTTTIYSNVHLPTCSDCATYSQSVRCCKPGRLDDNHSDILYFPPNFIRIFQEQGLFLKAKGPKGFEV
jgi:hypothetical protein